MAEPMIAAGIAFATVLGALFLVWRHWVLPGFIDNVFNTINASIAKFRRK